MKNKILTISIIVIVIISLIIIYIYSDTRGLRDLERKVSDIVLPNNIETIAIKSAIGDSGGNGDQSSFRVVLLVKTEITIDELKQELNNMNLKIPNHYKSLDNTPIFYITNCESEIFKSSRDFSMEFNELKEIEDYSNYYFIEFVE